MYTNIYTYIHPQKRITMKSSAIKIKVDVHEILSYNDTIHKIVLVFITKK